MRTHHAWPIQHNEHDQIVQKCLQWAQQDTHFSYFNPNKFIYPHDPFVHFIAVGLSEKVSSILTAPFEKVKQYWEQHHDWLIGYWAYDLKNYIEDLSTSKQATIPVMPAYFYKPKHLIFFKKDSIEIHTLENPHNIYQQIVSTPQVLDSPRTYPHVIMQPKETRETYLEKIHTLQKHILEGDIYEANYCIEFFNENANILPFQTYERLNKLSPMPFSIFQRINDTYLISASPERFLKKIGKKLISQPIKGTIRRGKNAIEDTQLKEQLRNSEKERAENMMIVDLVRNDLARSCIPGTIQVEELFGIYSFQQLHQMISTITAELSNDTHFIDAIKYAFPMGSMTGAPKIKAMQLIDTYEATARGLYSSAAGYITPTGDFDFNVIIRSLVYEASLKKLSYHVGSAITYDAIPQNEYEECLLKAKALAKVVA